MHTLPTADVDIEKVREEWTAAVNSLVSQISHWSHERNWKVEQHPRQIEEESLGTYTVPDAVISTPNGNLVLEVKGRGAFAGPGRVELAAWPTLYRVLLIHHSGNLDWTVRTDSGISLRQPWTKETFLALADDLLAAE